MAVTIQQLRISHFRRFEATQTFEFATPDEGSGFTSIIGQSGSGKTTIVDAIRLCLYGRLESEYPQPYVTHELVDGLDVGESEVADLSVVLSDPAGTEYRIRRRVKAVMTPRGAESDIEDATVETREAGTWTQATEQSLADTLDSTLPEFLDSIVFYDGETTLGIQEEWVDSIGITELAAVVQQVAETYPELSTTDPIGAQAPQSEVIDALLDAANGYFDELVHIDGLRLRVDSEDERAEVKVARDSEGEYLMSAGTQMALSFSFLLAVHEVLPVELPLFLDAVLGRVDNEFRKKILYQLSEVANESQVVLLSSPYIAEDISDLDAPIGATIELRVPDLAHR